MPPKRKAPGDTAPKERQSKLAKEHNISAREEREIKEAFALFAEPMDGEKEGVIPTKDVRRAMMPTPDETRAQRVPRDPGPRRRGVRVVRAVRGHLRAQGARVAGRGRAGRRRGRRGVQAVYGERRHRRAPDAGPPQARRHDPQAGRRRAAPQGHDPRGQRRRRRGQGRGEGRVRGRYA
ncbi:hypothetical protein F4821DRAFT_12137 [Hypoxylon rubiginosum]|uniref:Uncharacterized protein n=1 Tax=Hypoxylon rubiginosum TaxID=110542 RepID=A0ACC0DE47_9PEZI|nr:hypothetical protein F4821DRAFT_12137 [Hypoxylon rubiginosum]